MMTTLMANKRTLKMMISLRKELEISSNSNTDIPNMIQTSSNYYAHRKTRKTGDRRLPITTYMIQTSRSIHNRNKKEHKISRKKAVLPCMIHRIIHIIAQNRPMQLMNR